MAKIVISEFMATESVDYLRQRFQVVFDPSLVDNRPALLTAVCDADAIIVRNRTQVDLPLLSAAPHLKVVGRLGVGLDNINLKACDERAVAVMPAQGGNASSVAEYVLTGILLLRRQAYFSSQAMLAGQWPRQMLIGHEVAGSVLGLVGFGAIARETAHRARALGMKIIAFDPHLPADLPVWDGVERHQSLSTLLQSADAVSLHLPLTDETRHLINADALKQMKYNAILINAARGGIVDEAALADALRHNRLAGALVDVFEQEPLPSRSVFDAVPNLILTPHIAGVTVESNARISQITADNVISILDRTEKESGK